MEKREIAVYLYLGVLIVAAILAIYFFNIPLTGFAILGQYNNESGCVEAGYTWTNSTNESCVDISGCVVCASGCVTNYTQTLCATDCQQTCAENSTGCVVCASGCVTNYTQTLCATDCQQACQNCTMVVVGGQCTGIICDSDNLNLCLNNAGCTSAGGYWYDDVCNTEEESSCSNDLSLCLDITNCEDAGGYWYDDVCNTEEETIEQNETESTVQIPVQPVQQDITDLSLQAIEKSTLNPSDSKNLNLVVNNIGNTPLSACALTVGGNYALWLSVPEISQNINAGETKNFAFSMNVPKDAEEGSYVFSLSVQCAEKIKSSEFSVEVVKKRIEFNIIGVERTRADRVVVSYTLKELLNEKQNISLKFFLYDAGNAEVGNASVNQKLSAGGNKDFTTNIAVNKSLEGNLTLSANLNAEKYSVSVKKPITLIAPTGFFALGENLGTTGNVLAIVILLVIVVGIFFLLKRKNISKKVLPG